jgi:shikimate kinase
MSAGPAGPVSLPHRIVLTGFMGAGKSTAGRILAARLHWPFFDIDSLITAEHGRTVAQIFADHGEEHFRRLEAATTARALDPSQGYKRAVIALGGGAIETEAIRQLLFPSRPSGSASMPTTVTIFLSAPLPELLARCHVSPGPAQEGATQDETPVRPLLTAAEPPEDRLARRLPHYRRAHLTVDTVGIPAVEVVDRILVWLSVWLSEASSSARSSGPAAL